MKKPYTYILSSQRYGTLYIGVTSNLARRMYEHKNDIFPGFSSKYKTVMLVHAESYATMQDAIKREKQLKKWHRIRKISLIEEHNPEWNDLSIHLLSINL